MRIIRTSFMISIVVSVLGLIIGCGDKTEEEAANTAPVINSFSADNMSVSPGDQVTLTISAEDAEDDSLTYTYQPDGGSVTGTGDTVIWIAPATAGSYEVNVSVSDGELDAQNTVTITVVAAQQDEPQDEPQEEHAELRIQWLGHACFLIASSDGTRILTDPFNASVGYTVSPIETDVAIVSHSHGDHSNVSMSTGNPEIINTTIGDSTAAGISFRGVRSYHDNTGGSQRGMNTIFVWEMDGMRLAHLGDLGQPELTDDQLAEIGDVDILFIPVGGFYTIDAAQATDTVEQLSPKLVFPMHYKTDVMNSPISTIDGFLAGKDNVERVGQNFTVVEELPEEMKIIVLDYK